MRINLINARKQFNKTQKELASIIGVSERTYQSMEAGTTKGKIEKWDLLSSILSKSISNLIYDDTKNYIIITCGKEE